MRTTSKKLNKILEDALLKNTPMDLGLYKYELEELLPEIKAGLKEGNGNYAYAITMNSHQIRGDVTAMILVDKTGKAYVNEEARDKLKELWGASYVGNIRKILPAYAKELNKGAVPICGINETLIA